jgi:hypothetical protein
MAHILDPHLICTDSQYRAARSELDALIGAEFDMPLGHRVDELIELIESYEGSMRFVPDWSDEGWQHAA